MNVRALIVDDEPPARAKIRKFLAGRHNIDLAGEAGDGVEAIEKTLALLPDLLFLDIQMPRGDGFDVLKEVYPVHQPAVIFTTAYDNYAIRAFEVQAVDYLLKPFTAERFDAAVDRALRARAVAAGEDEKIRRLLREIQSGGNRVRRVLVRSSERIFFVKSSEIEWVEAEEKYVFLHTRAQQRHMIRQSISGMENQLAPGFVRIHRGALVNLEFLVEVLPNAHGDCTAVLKSGVRLNVGRSYKDTLLKAMEGV